MKEGNVETNTCRLTMELPDITGKTRRFRLEPPKSVSRPVLFRPKTKTVNAFHLPLVNEQTVEFEGQFVGDVNRGGSCNVDNLLISPHGITHLETSAHILSTDSEPAFVNDIPTGQLTGLVYLMDISDYGHKPGQTILAEPIAQKLAAIDLPVSMLAIKTHSSLLPWDYNFSSQDFLALSPEAASAIHDHSFPMKNKTGTPQQIKCLLVDLPSLDPESDGGKLKAHRNFFGLPEKGFEAGDKEKRAVVELLWFSGLEEGYYYAVITPPRFQTNAVATGVIFYPLKEM